MEEKLEKLERLQSELRVKVGEVEGEVGVVKARMAAEFDEILRKREREFSSKITELNTGKRCSLVTIMSSAPHFCS